MVRGLWLVVLAALLVAAPSGWTGAARPGGLAEAVPSVLRALSSERPPIERALDAMRAVAGAEGIPVAAHRACITLPEALARHAGRLHVPTPAVTTPLPRATADSLGCILGALDDANAALDATTKGLTGAQVLALLASEEAPGTDALRTLEGRSHAANLVAAIHLLEAVEEALPVLRSPSTSLVGLDLPPILSFQPQGVQTYASNYALIVDLDGDDTYDNHAGGVFVAAGNSIFEVEPGTGTEEVVPATGHHVGVGGNVQDADITLSSSLVVDLGGNDTYGVKHAPTLHDVLAACGTSPRVSMVGTIGAGILGVGMLVDLAGDNHYVGRTQSQGAGHVFGVGVLVSGPGADRYEAVRAAQGSGLLGGFGFLVDEGGADQYALAAPEGGVFNGDLQVCDTDARYGQGGNFDRKDGPFTPTIGLLADLAGDDTYVSPHKSQGFSQGGGFGLLLDVGGDDQYRSGEKAQGAGNGRAVEFSPQVLWSGGVGLLLDLQGDDAYAATQMAQGWALGTGLTDPPPPADLAEILLFAVQRNEAVGLLWDAGGADEYAGPSGRGDGSTLIDGTLGVFSDSG